MPCKYIHIFHCLMISLSPCRKAASHDLKGLLGYFNAGIPELRLPLMVRSLTEFFSSLFTSVSFQALIDYMGFRLIAISTLPVNKSRL